MLETAGEDDHVHLLVSNHPKVAVSALVSKLKGKSSYFLRKEYWPELKRKLWGDHLWSPSYCVVSCGGAPLEVVREYVEEQRKPPSAAAVRQSRQERGQSRPRKKV